jgi:hypothetical protein
MMRWHNEVLQAVATFSDGHVQYGRVRFAGWGKVVARFEVKAACKVRDCRLLIAGVVTTTAVDMPAEEDLTLMEPGDSVDITLSISPDRDNFEPPRHRPPKPKRPTLRERVLQKLDKLV